MMRLGNGLNQWSGGQQRQECRLGSACQFECLWLFREGWKRLRRIFFVGSIVRYSAGST